MTGSNQGAQIRGHLLVVDDDVIMQLVLTDLLSGQGYKVTAVGDGKSALEALQANEFDLVLMDCRMPKMDGITTVRKIRLGSGGVLDPRVPVIALTGRESGEDVAACIEAGMDGHLSKPPDVPLLLDTIEQHIRGAREHKAQSGQGTAGSGARPHPADGKPEEEHTNAFMDRMLARFVEEVPELVARLELAVLEKDIVGLMNLGHKVRGSSAVIGASLISGRAAELESAAITGDLRQCGSLARRLISELQKLARAVDQEE